METIGDRIKQKRKELNLTQLQLAEKLQVTDRAVSKWEQNEGNPDFSLLVPLAEILGVSLDYLMTGKTEEDSISLDDMDERKRLNYLIKKDDDKNFIKYGCVKSVYSKLHETINNKTVSRLETSIWELIIDANAKKIFKICCDDFIEKNKSTGIATCLIRGMSDKFVKMAFELDHVELFKVLDVRHFSIGTDQKLMGNLYNIRLKYNASSGESNSTYINGDHATKINLETLEYMFKNAKKSPLCFEYITSFDMPTTNQYHEVFCEFTFLEKAILDLSIKYNNIESFNRVLSMYKQYADLCVYQTANGIFYNAQGSYVFHSGGYYPIGRIFSFDEDIIKKVIMWDKPELLKQCLDYNKVAIEKLTNVDGRHYDKSNRGVFLLTEPEIERYFNLNNSKTSKEDKFLLECVNNHIVVPSKIIESRDLKFVKKVLSENYYNYFEFAFDAVVNGKRKEFFKFLVDNEIEDLATCLMMNDAYDPEGKELLLNAWNLFSDTRNVKYSKIVNNQNKIFDDPKDNRNITFYSNNFIWSLLSESRGQFVDTHESMRKIEEAITNTKDNVIINFIKKQKEQIYLSVNSSIEAEKQAEKEKIERQKIVKGLSKDYFNNLLSTGGNELFIIKLCSLLDAIFKFDYHYDGEDFSVRMSQHFSSLEKALPTSRDCDDGWGYMVLDTEYENSVVIPAKQKLDHLKDLFYRLRVQRNNIAHSETNPVKELNFDEMNEALEYVFSINKVEE